MTVMHDAEPRPALFGQEGELVSVCVAVEPRLLEDLLETLAALDFPVNPELYHHIAEVSVEFPAYSAQLEKIRGKLVQQGFASGSISCRRVLARAQSA
ncbi:MAG TPA: hypothetical protein VKX49_31040 [Bryobacteraceae bacterium]|nr:hypothetical protein [Bryobacteraceae bacterium]